MKQKKCVYCDTIYPIDSEQCPLCGGTFADEIDTAEPEKAAAEAPVTPVAPVAPIKPRKQKVEPVYEEEFDDEEEVDGNPTPRWMTALISVVLALALVVGLAFIGYSLGFFDGKDDPDDQVSLPLDDPSNNQTQIPPEGDVTPDENLNGTPNVDNNQQPDEQQPTVEDPAINQDPVDDPTVDPDEQDPPVDPDEQEPPVDPDETDEPDEPDEPAEPQNPCASISLSHTDVTLFKKGESFTIKPTLNPTDCDEKIVWTSSNEAYATVSANGKVTAVNGKNNGSVTITATCGKQKAECIVRLAFAESESGSTTETDNETNGAYSLNLTDFTMMFNGEQVEVEVKNSNLMNDSFVWTIDDPDIASIVVAKDTCIVTAVTSGTTKLHVVINDTTELTCIVRCSKGVGSGAETGAETGE